MILVIKYIIAVLLLALVILMPAYLAGKTEQNKTNTARVRCASWLLGWTIIAWIWSLFRATSK